MLLEAWSRSARCELVFFQSAMLTNLTMLEEVGFCLDLFGLLERK